MVFQVVSLLFGISQKWCRVWEWIGDFFVYVILEEMRRGITWAFTLVY